MERRVFQRLNSNIMMRFYCTEAEYTGTIINLSSNGMCINIGDNFLPCGMKVKLCIPLVKKVVNLYAKISRIVKLNDLNYTIGVELLNPPKNYMEFAERYRNTFKS